MPWEWESRLLAEKDIDMADVTPQFIRGFLVPMAIGFDNVWEDESTFSQEGSRAGDPEPNQASKMRLLATGQQSDGGNLTVVTRKAGSAGFGSRFTFTQNNSSTTIEYGRDTYNSVSAFEFRLLAGAVGLTSQYYVPTSFRTNADSLLVAYQTTTTTSIKHVSVMRVDRTGTQTITNIFSIPTGFSTGQFLHPSICQLADESLILCHVYEDDGTANIRVHRSIDDGVSWDTVARESLDVGINVGTVSGVGVDTYEIKRLRIASNGSAIVMLIETEYNNTSATKRNVLFQFVSIDGGGTFTLLSTDTNLSSNSFHSINLGIRNGRFVVSYISELQEIQYLELPNPFSNIHLLRIAQSPVDISAPSASTGTNDFMADGDTTMVIDDDGGIYLYFYSGGLNEYIVAQYSSDGTIFRYMNGAFSVANGTVLNMDDATTRVRGMAGVNWLGRNIIVSNCDATSTVDNSLLFTYLGGYANVNLPRSRNTESESDWGRVGYVRSYFPIDEPSNITGLTISGTGDDRLSNGFLKITSSATFPSHRYYTWTNLPTTLVPANYINQGLLIRTALKPITGGNVGTEKRGFGAILDDGTDLHHIEVYITTSAIRFYDVNGTAVIANVTIDTTDGIEIMAACSNRKVSFWYRVHNYDELRDWIVASEDYSLTAAASTAAKHSVYWGHLNYTSGTVETDWLEFHISTLDAVGVNMSTGFSNPEDSATRPYPPIGQYAYLFDGVRISSSDGPTYEGESFDITPQYDYPVENVFYQVAPTPRIDWRSQPVGSGNVPSQEIAIKLDETDYINTYTENMPNDLMGFHFNGINWKDGEIFYHNGTTWVSLAQIDNAIHCSCIVSGRTARGGTIDGKPYFTLDELVGWTCYFPVGEDKHFRKITTNTEGKFGHGGGTTVKNCIVTFDEAPPQSATEIYFIPPVITMVISTNGIKASGFKIVTGAQPTYHNDIRIGEMIIGPVIVPGRQYSRGRTISIESGTVTTETQDGIRYGREIEPPKRSFRIAWTDGIDISQLQGAEPDVDYWKASNQTGSEPIAVENEAPDLMLGFLKHVQGSRKHFVYIPNITKSTSSAGDKRLLQREREQALVTLDSDVTIEHVVGDELQTEAGEVFRIANMSFLEVK